MIWHTATLKKMNAMMLTNTETMKMKLILLMLIIMIKAIFEEEDPKN